MATTQTVQTKKTLAQYKSLAAVAVKSLETAYGELGRILLDAETDLGKQEYAELVLHLKHQGLSAAQISAARGVAQKKIDSSLIFYADKKLRLPALPMPVQEKLRKIDHPIKKPDGVVEKKKWDRMSASERLQLVGPKYNRLIPPDEQVVKTYGSIPKTNVHFNGDSLVLNRSTLLVKDLVAKLRSQGQLDAFVTLITRLTKSKERKSA